MSQFIDDFQRFAVYDLVKGDNVFIPRARKTVTVHPRITLTRYGPKDVALTTTPQPLGGERLWFRCPACDQRVGTIFAPPLDDDLRCRKCWRLRYPSELHHRNRHYELIERPRRHVGIIESRLYEGWGGKIDWDLVALGLPRIKRYMRAARFQRLVGELHRWASILRNGEAQEDRRRRQSIRTALQAVMTT
jgi:hypothetical protein